MSLKFCVILILFATTLSGKESNEKFISFSTGNGKLTHNTVEAIARDSFGYVWIATNYGLNRLDGYQTDNFINNPNDSNSISSNHVKTLLIDKSNDLWIGTIGGGLNKYDQRTHNFIHYSPSNSGISSPNISSIAEDKDGNIWLGTSGNGIDKLIKKTGAVEQYNLSNADPYRRTNSNVGRLFCDFDGNIWAGLNQGEVFKIDVNTKKITYYGLFKEQPGFKEIGSIKGIGQQKSGTLLFASWNGYLYEFNPKTDQQITLSEKTKKLNNSILSDIAIDNEDNIWISTWDDGLIKIDSKKEEVLSFRQNRIYPSNLGSNALNELYIDKQNNLWIGSLDNGASLLPLQDKMFKTLKIEDLESPMPIGINAYSIIRDRNNNLWIGTRGQGLWQYNLLTGKTTNYLSKDINSILELKLSDNGMIWIGTDGNFVSLFDPKTKTFKKQEHKDDDWSQAIFSLAENKEFLWAGTWGGGIKKIDKKTGKYTSINFDEKDQFRNTVFDLELRDSILWIANVGIGLIKYNINSGEQTTYSHSDTLPEFPKERIIDIYMENSNSLLISTDGAGLYQFIPSEEKIMQVCDPDLLSSNIIQSAIIDKYNNLWVASISGISLIDKKTGTIYNFNKYNGLINSQLNKGVLFYDSISDVLYTGGVEGINYTNPSSIIIDSLANQVVITDLKILGKSITKPNERNIKKPINLTEKIDLYRKDKIITIHFSSMEFNPSLKNKYRYKLEGFEKDWTETSYSKNFVQYTNLYPGEYCFKIKACSSDGLYADNETSILIIVHPAFWQTIYFYLISISAIAFLILIYFKNRVKKLVEAKEKLEQKVAKRTSEIQQQKEQIEKQNLELKLANNTKNKFFSIISHDLRNPVASIDQMALLINMKFGKVSEEKMQLYFEALKNSSSQTLNLLDNLLIWAQTQTNRITINMEHISVDELISETVNSCSSFANKKNINLECPHKSNLMINIDKNTIQTVLRNLITNAIKFTKENGNVEIQVEDKKTKVVFKIVDNGVGMKKEVLENLFKIENLYSRPGTSGEKGTGLGLILCYEFLALNGGKIWVESELEKGSTFYFSAEKV
jgi:signal transduction histidine kinase/ligand-binding sensor domain-containing protein